MIYQSKNKALHIYDNWCNKTDFNEWFVIMPINEKYSELSLDGLLYEHSDDLEVLYEIYKDEYGAGYTAALFDD